MKKKPKDARLFKRAIKKWEYLSSGEARYEPECAFCRYESSYGKCVLGLGGVCRGIGYCCDGLYQKWVAVDPDGGFNSPRVIRAAKKVLAYIRQKAKEHGNIEGGSNDS